MRHKAKDEALVAKSLQHPFQNCKLFLKLIEPLASSCDPNMTQNEHVYVICCWPEAENDVISSQYVKTIEGYVLVNFEVASSSIFLDIQKYHFVMATAADISDSFKWKRYHVSLKKHGVFFQCLGKYSVHCWAN